MCSRRDKQNMSKWVLIIIHVRSVTDGGIFLPDEWSSYKWWDNAFLEVTSISQLLSYNSSSLVSSSTRNSYLERLFTVSWVVIKILLPFLSGETRYVMHHSALLALLSCRFMCEVQVPPTTDNQKTNSQADNKHTKWLLGAACNQNHVSG